MRSLAGATNDKYLFSREVGSRGVSFEYPYPKKTLIRNAPASLPIT
jgi:hypothetical protein